MFRVCRRPFPSSWLFSRKFQTHRFIKRGSEPLKARRGCGSVMWDGGSTLHVIPLSPAGALSAALSLTVAPGPCNGRGWAACALWDVHSLHFGDELGFGNERKTEKFMKFLLQTPVSKCGFVLEVRCVGQVREPLPVWPWLCFRIAEVTAVDLVSQRGQGTSVPAALLLTSRVRCPVERARHRLTHTCPLSHLISPQPGAQSAFPISREHRVKPRVW